MAHRIASSSREIIERPPIGWRKPIPLAIKLQVVINQQGKGPDGQFLDALIIGIHFDHRPPLHEREYDAARDDTIPGANDVRFIVALAVDQHRVLSKADVKRMRKTQRQFASELAFRKVLDRKLPGQKRRAKGTIRSRPFKRKDPLGE